MVELNLDKTVRRPAFSLKSQNGLISCLIDTGALISVWCLPLYLFLSSFPDAQKTNYRTTVSGFGGISYKKRDIWKIPEFTLEDENGCGKYIIRNLLVAIVDEIQATSFNMILSALIFHGSSYQIFDKDSDKRIEIYPMSDRPVVCVPSETIFFDTLDERISSALALSDDEILIGGITVFSEH